MIGIIAMIITAIIIAVVLTMNNSAPVGENNIIDQNVENKKADTGKIKTVPKIERASEESAAVSGTQEQTPLVPEEKKEEFFNNIKTMEQNKDTTSAQKNSQTVINQIISKESTNTIDEEKKKKFYEDLKIMDANK